MVKWKTQTNTKFIRDADGNVKRVVRTGDIGQEKGTTPGLWEHAKEIEQRQKEIVRKRKRKKWAKHKKKAQNIQKNLKNVSKNIEDQFLKGM